jgi:hypothetical protein
MTTKKKSLHQRIGAWLFKRIQKHHIKNLYQIFAVYTPLPTLITTDPCGISPDLDRVLTTQPLATLSSADIKTLLEVSAKGQCAPDLRYYLPRFFELLFAPEVVDLRYLELLCDYVSYEYPNLTITEQQSINQLLYLLLSMEFSRPVDEQEGMVVFSVALTPYDCRPFLRKIYLEEVGSALKKNPASLGSIVTIKEHLVERVQKYAATVTEDAFVAWSNNSGRQEILAFIKYAERTQTLTMNDPDFITKLTRALQLNRDVFSTMSMPGEAFSGHESVTVTSTVCAGWSLRYNLFNPENFEDPSTAADWYDPRINYEYYEKPFVDPTHIEISKTSLLKLDNQLQAAAKALETLETYIANKSTNEEKLLAFFIQYTFGNGGAYAAGEHFTYTMQSIGALQGIEYTPESFIKDLVQLRRIELLGEEDACLLHFDVAWDIEHGVSLIYKQGTFSVQP